MKYRYHLHVQGASVANGELLSPVHSSPRRSSTWLTVHVRHDFKKRAPSRTVASSFASTNDVIEVGNNGGETAEMEESKSRSCTARTPTRSIVSPTPDLRWGNVC